MPPTPIEKAHAAVVAAAAALDDAAPNSPEGLAALAAWEEAVGAERAILRRLEADLAAAKAAHQADPSNETLKDAKRAAAQAYADAHNYTRGYHDKEGSE